MRVSAGPLDAVPEGRCVVTADGSAIVARVGDEVRAYRNVCLHQASPLEGGWVRDGVITCPLHFWRYDFDDGAHRGGNGALESYPVSVVDGELLVDVPDRGPARSLREQLLARAEGYDRDRAWREERAGDGRA